MSAVMECHTRHSTAWYKTCDVMASQRLESPGLLASSLSRVCWYKQSAVHKYCSIWHTYVSGLTSSGHEMGAFMPQLPTLLMY